MCFACIEELQEGEHSREKPLIRWLVYRKDLFSSVFATFTGSSGDRIRTEVNCQISGKRLYYIETFAFSIKKYIP